ncbi:T9SS type A sorting domain-containing protein [Bacteroides heparinolyticus]|uniref:T9SS type A sorting domain-containing protein n=1 Tax=Prevotella heparinolytica TaxID=28113 RepID=UPI0035A0B734
MQHKTHFKVFFSLLFVLAAAAPCLAQQRGTVTFGYDADGNRISRNITFKKDSENGRSLSDSLAAEQPTASDSFDGRMRVTLYPNPTYGQFSVSVEDAGTDSPLRAVLSTATGTVITDRTISEGRTEFDLGGQAAGTYVLRLTAGKETHVWKVIRK